MEEGDDDGEGKRRMPGNDLMYIHFDANDEKKNYEDTA